MRFGAGLIRQLALAVLCLIAVIPVRAEPLPRSVILNHHLELPEGCEPTLNFELSIPTEQLVFRRDGGGFTAEIRIALRATRSGDKHVESALLNETVSRPDFLTSRVPGERFEKQFEIPLGPGKWSVEVMIFRKGDRAPWKRSFKLHVPEPGDGRFFLQGPSWRAECAGGRLSEPFTFRDPWVLEKSEAQFADGLDGRVTLECDLIFWEEPLGEVELLFSLIDTSGRLCSYARRTLRPHTGRNAVGWELVLDRISMGAYLAEVELIAEEGRARVRGRLDVGLTGAAFGRDWDHTLSLIRDLTTAEEWELLELAEDGAHLDAWETFWERRDPNGSARGNAFREGFWNRFRDANDRFGSTFQEGYLSDRGRIYLELGEPDRIETYQDDRNFRVLLYWHYGRLGRVYIFEDRHGYENFTLIRING